MAIIQPVPSLNIAELIRQGLGAAQGFQKLRASQQTLGRQQEIDELTGGVATPESRARLAQLDPQRARQTQQLQEFEDRRFQQERAQVAGQIEGQPLAEQVRIIDQQIDRVIRRGGDPKNTVGLRELLLGGPETFEQAQGFIRNARIQGEQQGFLKPRAEQRPESRTGLVKDAIAAGFVEGTPEFRSFIEKARLRPQTQINLGGGQTEQKELAKIRASQFSSISEKADTARTNVANLDILDTIDVSTGKAEPMKQAIAAFGASFGVNTSALANVPAGEAFTAVAGRTVLDAMAAQKGPQTESDMRQIRQTVSGLSKDPRANKFINNSARALSLRRIEQNDFYGDFLEENDSLKGVGRAWNKHIREVPMISRNLKTPEGLPLFFHEFERLMKEQFGEDTPREDIIFTWRQKDRPVGRK